MATPSLAMIPSAIADAKVFSVLPNNGDGDFTFNRDSSATRVGQNGLIQTVGFFGNNFVTNGTFETDTDWTKGTGWTIGSGVASCDGVQTGSYLSQTSSSTLVLGKTYKVNFDLIHTSGTLLFMLASSNPLTNTSGNITTGGSKEFYITISSLSDQLIYFRSNLFNGSIDNVSVKEVTGDQPRLNYDISNGVVQSCPSLLLEPASTNLITYSEAFDNAYWVKSSSTVTSGFMSPDGTLNAYKIIANANNSATAHSIYHNPGFSITSGLDYTTTAYLKYDNQQYARLEFGSTGGMGFPLSQRSVVVDLINGTINTPVSPAKATIKKFTGGFYEVSLTTTSAASGVTSSGISFTDALGNNIITNGNESIIAFGIQAENLSYATSYIPNFGQSAGVTRAVESCNDAGNASTFSDSEGVLYAEISALADDLSNRAISLSDGSLNNGVQMFYYNVSNRIRFRVYAGGVLQGTINKSSITITDNHKIALKWESGFMSVFVDGVIVGTRLAIISTPTGLDRLNFNLGQGSSTFYGNTKDIRVFNEALTDAQLQTLTTL